MAIYRVNFLVRLEDGTRVTSPFMVETTSFLGALSQGLRKWDPAFDMGSADVYGINIREIRPRGSRKNV